MDVTWRDAPVGPFRCWPAAAACIRMSSLLALPKSSPRCRTATAESRRRGLLGTRNWKRSRLRFRNLVTQCLLHLYANEIGCARRRTFMSNVFNVGQVVALRSGGPQMTVVSVANGKIQEAYYCTWFTGDKQHFGEFLGEALVALKEDRRAAPAIAHQERVFISSKDIQGAAVYGLGDESIGQIDHLLIEQASGRVAYAITSFGGFLGLAHRLYPIPWSTIKYDTSLQGYRTGITEAQLRDAPTFSDDSLMNRGWETQTHQHYDAPTYWGSTTAHQRSGSS
jgi:uncharacterized protein YodC (DUF2158 family)